MSFIISLGIGALRNSRGNLFKNSKLALQAFKPQRQTIRSVKTSTVDWKPIKSGTTDLAKKEHQVKHAKVRYFFLSLMIAMPVVSFILGCWQVQRLDWKTKLIARTENSLTLPPLEELPADLDPKVIPEFEYRKIKIKGHFDYEQEMFLGPRKRPDGELGYLVVCPFVRSNGGKPILVERGWISKEKIVPSTRSSGYLLHLALPKGEIEIVAMFRVMPPRSFLQYSHDEGSRLFFIPDVEAMAAQSGALPIYCQAVYDMSDHPEYRSSNEKLAESQKGGSGWFFSKGKSANGSPENMSSLHDDADSTLEYLQSEFVNEGVPIGTVPKVGFKNNHLQYLVTWFALSLFSTGLLIYSLAKGRSSLADKVIAAKRIHMKKME